MIKPIYTEGALTHIPLHYNVSAEKNNLLWNSRTLYSAIILLTGAVEGDSRDFAKVFLEIRTVPAFCGSKGFAKRGRGELDEFERILVKVNNYP